MDDLLYNMTGYTISDCLNGTILFFVIGIGSLFIYNTYIYDPPAPVKSTVFTNYGGCKLMGKRLVARPAKQTAWGEMSAGYDCVD